MWKAVGKPRTVRITRDLAHRFATMEAPPQDRPLSERRLGAYRRMVLEGLFRPVSWATCECLETGTTYRVNGKHTSTLFSGLAELPELYAVIEHYQAKTLEDVARLYSTFDSREQVRSPSELNRAFSAAIPELRPLPGKVVDQAILGFAFHNWGERYHKHPAPERAELLFDAVGAVDFVLWLNDVGGKPNGRQTKHLYRCPVVAAMYGNWLRDPESATTFWSSVRDETGSSPDLPDRKIARYLLTHSIDRGAGGRSSKVKADSREFYVRCLHAWNAWRRGARTDLRYHPNAPIPAIA